MQRGLFNIIYYSGKERHRAAVEGLPGVTRELFLDTYYVSVIYNKHIYDFKKRNFSLIIQFLRFLQNKSLLICGSRYYVLGGEKLPLDGPKPFCDSCEM